MTTKTVEVGGKSYSVSLNSGRLNHLCTFREISDFKLTVQKKCERFGGLTTDDTPLDADELNLVSSIFATAVFDCGGLDSDVVGFLATMNVGNAFRWSYTQGQKKRFIPIFEHIGYANSMSLYKQNGRHSSYLEEGTTSSDEKIIELKMFNFDREVFSDISSKLAEYKKVISDKFPPEVVEAPVNTNDLTEEAIREYLRQGN